MLYQFTHGLKLIIGHKVLKDNPQTFEKAYVLAKQMLQIINLVGRSNTRSKWCEPPYYAPMELESMGAC